MTNISPTIAGTPLQPQVFPTPENRPMPPSSLVNQSSLRRHQEAENPALQAVEESDSCCLNCLKSALHWIVYILTFSACKLFPKNHTPDTPLLEVPQQTLDSTPSISIDGEIPPPEEEIDEDNHFTEDATASALIEVPPQTLDSNPSTIIDGEAPPPEEEMDEDNHFIEDATASTLIPPSYNPSRDEMLSLVNYLRAKGYSSNQTWEETTQLLKEFLQDPTISHGASFCNCLSRPTGNEYTQIYGSNRNINEDYLFLLKGSRNPAHYQYAKALTILEFLLRRRGCSGEEYFRIECGKFYILEHLYSINSESNTCERLIELLDESARSLYNDIQNFGGSVKLQIAIAVANYKRAWNDQPGALKIFEAILQSASIENSEKAPVKLEMAKMLHHFRRYQEGLVILEDLLQDPEAMPTVKAQAKKAKLYAFLESGQESSEVLSCLDDFLADTHVIGEKTKGKAIYHTSDYFCKLSEGRQAFALYDRIIWRDYQDEIKFLKAELLFKGCGDLEKDSNKAKLLYEEVLAASVSEHTRTVTNKRLRKIATAQHE